MLNFTVETVYNLGLRARRTRQKLVLDSLSELRVDFIRFCGLEDSGKCKLVWDHQDRSLEKFHQMFSTELV